MKKMWWFFGLWFLGMQVEAAENPLQLSLGVEANMNPHTACIFGHTLSLEAQFFKYIVNGVILTISNDFNRLTVIEPELFARWYFLQFGLKGGGFFVQGDLGMSLLMENTASQALPLGGITLGFRYPFPWGDYFVEPYVRGGYPFLVGFGLRAGCRL